MEFPDNLLIMFEEGIFARCKSNQRRFPISASIDFATIGRAFLDKIGNSPLNKLLRVFVKCNPFCGFHTFPQKD
jgi:hypothetical protein